MAEKMIPIEPEAFALAQNLAAARGLPVELVLNELLLDGLEAFEKDKQEIRRAAIRRVK